MSNVIPIGTRVKTGDGIKPRIGVGFRNQTGTVVKHLGQNPDRPFYQVDFDFTDTDTASCNGGPWSRGALVMIETPDQAIARLTAEVAQLNVDHEEIATLLRAARRDTTGAVRAAQQATDVLNLTRDDRDQAREVRDTYREERDRALVRVERLEAEYANAVEAAQDYRAERDEAREQRDVALNEARIAGEAYDQQQADRDMLRSDCSRLVAALDHAHNTLLTEEQSAELSGFVAGWTAANS